MNIKIIEIGLDTKNPTGSSNQIRSISSQIINEIGATLDSTLFSEIESKISEISFLQERLEKTEIIKEIFANISNETAKEIKRSLLREGSLYESIHEQIFSVVINIMESYSIDKLINLKDVKNKYILSNILDIQRKIIEGIKEEAFKYKANISEDKIIKIKSSLTDKYPNVGKSNLSILKNLKKLDNEYIQYVKKEIVSETEKYLSSNFIKYKSSGDIINDMLLFFSLTIKNGFSNYYMNFIEKYMNDLFKEISERKNQTTNNINQKKQQEEIHIKQSGNSTRKKECSNEINVFLDELPDKINTNEKEKKEIKSYVLRIYLNGKTIRIKDMIYNFPVTKDLFTEDFIKKAKEVGIIFENLNLKKEEEPEPQPENKNTNPDTEENESPMQVEEEVKVAFEKKVDWFLNNIKTFDGKGFVGIMKLAGYEIENENHVSKCFNKLYHNAQMKQIFLDELKRNIFLQEKIIRKKSSYRKINVYQKKGHRILFLQNSKTIDGIYNHDDYEKRVDVFLGC